VTTILVIDDVAPMAEQYAFDLARVGGYETLTASSGDEGLERLRRDAVDCVILDLEMPVVDGLQVLRTMARRAIHVPVIVYTGAGDFDRCVEAMRLGAYGFIDKAEPIERVVHEVESALKRRALEREVASLRKDLGHEAGLIGGSRPMVGLRDAVAKIAPIPSPVLIVGESGTGKELVARAIHQASRAARGPFLPINCAALPDQLVESELFGHERGAFTGADRQRKGAFEAASGGTLFLDEVGELPRAAQAKLLRVLEGRTIMRVGGTKELPVDARVVAATNRDLDRAVAEKGFREDLLFRLNVHVVRVPPLRERLSDIPELARHFLSTTCTRFGIPVKTLTSEAVAALGAYEWRRNNVRELRNIIERMVIAGEGSEIGRESVPAEIAGDGTDGAAGSTFQALKAEAERQIVLAALERHDWHVTNSAAALGLADHASLLKIMRRLGIQRPGS